MSGWPIVSPADPRIDYEPAIDQWQVETPFQVRDPMSGQRVDIEQGFTAEPSVPRLFWRAIPPHHLGKLGPVTHDKAYRDPRVALTQAQADRLFLLLMLLDGVKAWKAIAAYLAVRAFGHRSWRKGA